MEKLRIGKKRNVGKPSEHLYLEAARRGYS